jgi:hypothetical protein
MIKRVISERGVREGSAPKYRHLDNSAIYCPNLSRP